MKNNGHFVQHTKLFGAVLGVAYLMAGCTANAAPSEAQIQALAKKTKEQLVFVKGGEFQMGDFGEIHSEEKMQYSGPLDDGPLHKVIVSDFSISKYKVTLADYDIYAGANNLPLPFRVDKERGTDLGVREHPRSAEFPVGVDWQDAKNYCQWIGKKINLQMGLPSEAQWEYAARARGRLMIFATDNGLDEPGRNYATFEQVREINGQSGGNTPVGMYPPNPLGLFDLGMNGFEWTEDWYAEDYYSRSPVDNPRGPQVGTKKVVRGQPNGNPRVAMTFVRRTREPKLVDSKGTVTNRSYNFRCVAHGL